MFQKDFFTEHRQKLRKELEIHGVEMVSIVTFTENILWADTDLERGMKITSFSAFQTKSLTRELMLFQISYLFSINVHFQDLRLPRKREKSGYAFLIGM